MNSDRAILKLPIDTIAIPAKRIGYFDPDHAAQLGSDIAANGQHDPIHVKRNGNAAKLPWTLIAGLHRLRGLEGAGLTKIDAIQVADASATEAELLRLELSENLDHRHRRPIERAIFIAEIALSSDPLRHPDGLIETPQQKAARVRWNASATAADASDPNGWMVAVAQRTGTTLRTFERYLRLYREIVEALPNHAERLNFHPLGESLRSMTELARIKMPGRERAVEAVLSREDWKSVNEALVAAGIQDSTGKRSPDFGVRARDAWAQMSLHQRQAHVDYLADKMTPSMAIKLVRRLKTNGRLP